MLRSSTTAIGLALVVTVLAGCGGDKSATKADTTTATAAPPAVTTPAPATTTTVTPTKTTAATPTKTTAGKPAKAKTTTKQAPPPPRTQATPPQLESSPSELAKRAKANAEKAQQGGARNCPDLKTPAEAKDITVLHISCATAKKIIFATTPQERSGFVCDIVNESFSDVPAVEYSCNRKADKATLGYTAVG